MAKEKGKGIPGEFKAFIMRGNVIDMAVGVIIGGAFQKIITSLVDDVIMPVITLITGGIDFNNWFVALDGGEICLPDRGEGRRRRDPELRHLYHGGHQLSADGGGDLSTGQGDERAGRTNHT